MRQKFITVSFEMILEQASVTFHGQQNPVSVFHHVFHPQSHLKKHRGYLRSSPHSLIPARIKRPSPQLPWLPAPPGSKTKHLLVAHWLARHHTTTPSSEGAWPVEFSYGHAAAVRHWGLLLTQSGMDIEGEVSAVLEKLFPNLSKFWCPHWQYEMIMHLLHGII